MKFKVGDKVHFITRESGPGTIIRINTAFELVIVQWSGHKYPRSYTYENFVRHAEIHGNGLDRVLDEL